MKPIQQRGRPLTDLAKNVTACYHVPMRARDDLSTYSRFPSAHSYLIIPPPLPHKLVNAYYQAPYYQHVTALKDKL
jgi:hypothetical protein